MEKDLDNVLFRKLPSERIAPSRYGLEIIYLMFKSDLGFYDRWMTWITYGENVCVTDEEKAGLLLKMRKNLFLRKSGICEEEIRLMFDLWGLSLEDAMEVMKEFLMKDSGMC